MAGYGRESRYRRKFRIMTEDIIIERNQKSLCAICAKELDKDFRVEDYKGQKIWICKSHPSPNKEESDAEENTEEKE